MKPVHLTLVQGMPFQILVSVKERNESDELVPLPLTNCRVVFQARETPYTTHAALSLTSDTDDISVDEEDGTFFIDLTSERTKDISWPVNVRNGGRVRFQCEIIRPDADNIRALEGSILLDERLIQDG